MKDFADPQQPTSQIDKVIYDRSQLSLEQAIEYQLTAKRILAQDKVISESPLQINLQWRNVAGEFKTKVFAITMRSLGNDKFLILGLLYSEGIIKKISDVADMVLEDANENFEHDISSNNYSKDMTQVDNNIWLVQLTDGIQPNLTSIERFQTTYSSCGLCGATSLKALELKNPPDLLSSANNRLFVDAIFTVCNTMRNQQTLFEITGSVHSAALFNQQAQLLAVFEDIGRHNAVDKLIGYGLVEKTLPHFNRNQASQLLVMLVSGQVSFEIVQKVVMAGISILISVGAPSDLAIKAAKRFQLTLIGFVNAQSFNVYCGDWRISNEKQ